ncbi:MAG TPA: ChrR family anti-sigma-E factor [Caulobacteraceae bacterium]|jgi:putative transcriptional regulator
MTTPTRHPSEDLILDFARGALERGRAAVIEAHLGACPACRAAVRFAEAVGGALLEELPPADLAPDALEGALARIETPPPSPGSALAAPDDWIRVPADVLDAARGNRRFSAPGVWVAAFTGTPRRGARSYLLGIDKGIAVPRHTHDGKELVCILKGAFEDRGEVYQAGDFIESDDRVEHEPRVTRDGECVCLVSVDNSLVPRSLMARLFQPFVGI